MGDRYDRDREAYASVRLLARRLDLEARLQPFARWQWAGTAVDAPTLHLDDVSAIPFLVDIEGVEEYQHRARLRAAQGSFYAAATPPTDGYEEYCLGHLGLLEVQFVHAPSPQGGLRLAAAMSESGPWSIVVDAARRSGSLVIHPYMGIEDVWHLAERLSDDEGVEVTVIGPPPPVTWIANDKALFGEVVERTLGEGWLVESRLGSDAPSLAAALKALAQGSRRVGLKRLRCASAMGNEVYDAGWLRELSPDDLESEVLSFLKRTEWQGDEEVLVEVWEDSEHSPSTQLWIPPVGTGEPRLEGVYEQILAGERGIFVGSRTSDLPERVNRELGEASIAVARSLQSLGYVGRCSFDLLLVGDSEGDFEIRFTECNGRWGGTSTPMAFLDRLIGPPTGVRRPYRAQDFVRPGLVGASFREVLARVGHRAWSADSGKGRFIFYNTGPLERHGKLDVIALGRTREHADELMDETLPRLLGV